MEDNICTSLLSDVSDCCIARIVLSSKSICVSFRDNCNAILKCLKSAYEINFHLEAKTIQKMDTFVWWRTTPSPIKSSKQSSRPECFSKIIFYRKGYVWFRITVVRTGVGNVYLTIFFSYYLFNHVFYPIFFKQNPLQNLSNGLRSAI